MIKSINTKNFNSRRLIFWFELFHNVNVVLFHYCPEIPDTDPDWIEHYLSGETVTTIKNPSRDQILRIIDGKDIYVDGADLRYLVEHYICKDLVVPTI